MRKENKMKSKLSIRDLVLNFYRKYKVKRLNNTNEEQISDLINRLKKFDDTSDSCKFDVLSIPHALQMVLKIFPHKYCRNRLLRQRILKAFVSTVIPGADENDENLVSMYEDKYYPLITYCGYFAFDLNRKSKKLFNKKEFINLTLQERTKVIQTALNGRELTKRLYKGAILMAHVSYYGAVYNEERGCPLIDFPGRNNGYTKDEISYTFSSIFFDRELSVDGHPW
jgi:hypothetical protein